MCDSLHKKLSSKDKYLFIKGLPSAIDELIPNSKFTLRILSFQQPIKLLIRKSNPVNFEIGNKMDFEISPIIEYYAR